MALLGDTKAISLTLLDGVIGDLNPKTTDVYSLGTSALKWKNIYGDLKGNADTATEFSSNATVTLTGDTAGTSTGSKKSWSITTTTSNLTAVNDGANAITVSPGTKKLKYSYRISESTSGLFNTSNNSNAIFTFNRHDGNYDSQLGFSSNGKIYYRAFTDEALNTTKGWKQLAFIDSDITGNAATATSISTTGGTTANFWRGDNSWSNILTGNLELNAVSGDSPAILLTRGSNSLTDWKIFVTSGKLSFQSATDASTWTERAYFKDGSGDFVVNSLTANNLTASQAVVTDANKKLVSTSLAVTDSTTDPGLSYVYKVTQAATGKITATKATIRSASTSQTGVVSLSNATDSTSETVAATSKAVKTAYDLANGHKYWASLESTSTATYNSTPEVASVKYGNGTTATATKSFTIQFNATDESLDFVYAG